MKIHSAEVVAPTSTASSCSRNAGSSLVAGVRLALRLCVFALLVPLSACNAVSEAVDVCARGATQPCVCPGGLPGAQVCAENEERWLTCECAAEADIQPIDADDSDAGDADALADTGDRDTSDRDTSGSDTSAEDVHPDDTNAPTDVDIPDVSSDGGLDVTPDAAPDAATDAAQPDTDASDLGTPDAAEPDTDSPDAADASDSVAPDAPDIEEVPVNSAFPGNDGDGDGYAAQWGDCDDTNPAINPSSAELDGNGIDDDCDGSVDERVADAGSCNPHLVPSIAGPSADAFALPLDGASATNHCPERWQYSDWWVCAEFQNAASCASECAIDDQHLGEDWNFGTLDDDVGATVRAPANGVVAYVHRSADWVAGVVLRHDAPEGQTYVWGDDATSGCGRTIWTHSAHINFRLSWEPGDVLAMGDVLGEVSGTRCTNCVAPHLHHEVIAACDAPVPGPAYADEPLGRIAPSEFYATVRLVDQPAPTCEGGDLRTVDACGVATTRPCDWGCEAGACIAEPLCSDASDCPTPSMGDWSTCDFADECDELASRSRPLTSWTCEADGCVAMETVETETCERDTSEVVLSDEEWSSCTFDDECAETGTQERVVSRCVLGAATLVTETQSCERDTEGQILSEGEWSACDYADACDESAVQERNVDQCVDGERVTVGESASCERETDGAVLSTGDWTVCAYETDCAEDGERFRPLQVCVNGREATEQERDLCSRDTDGEVLFTGDWSLCDYSDECDEDSERVRSIEQCVGGRERSVEETEPCSRDTDGEVLFTGDWSLCDYSDECDEDSERVRSIEQCVSGRERSVEETEPCSRDTDGDVLFTGDWSLCDYSDECDEDSERVRSIEQCVGGRERSVEEFEPCSRNTDGLVLSSGSWSTCDYSSTCDERAESEREEQVCRNGRERTEFDVDVCSRNTDGESCGTGRECDSGSCETVVEVLNYIDDDGDGMVDEDFRRTIYRVGGSNGFGYSNPAVDADHCFTWSSSSRTCISGGTTFAYNPGGDPIAVYDLSIGSGTTVWVGSVLLARLAECYNSARTEHEMWTRDSVQYTSLVNAGWRCTDVGYVKTGRLANRDSAEISVRRHTHALATTTMYSTTVNEAQSLGFVDRNVAWFAWEAP